MTAHIKQTKTLATPGEYQTPQRSNILRNGHPHCRSGKCHLASSSVTVQSKFRIFWIRIERVCLPIVSREKHFYYVQPFIFPVIDKIFPIGLKIERVTSRWTIQAAIASLPLIQKSIDWIERCRHINRVVHRSTDLFRLLFPPMFIGAQTERKLVLAPTPSNGGNSKCITEELECVTSIGHFSLWNWLNPSCR